MSCSLDIASIGRVLRPTRRAAGLALLAAHFAADGLMRPRLRRFSIQDRLSMLQSESVPINSRVTIHWNEHLVPFIEAESDTDLATAIGIVHAHLRMGQLEMLRYLSRGRLSELIGPIAMDLDYLLRILDVGRAVPQILEEIPLATRQWLEAFVAGINHHLSHSQDVPIEFDLLGLKHQPWSVSDILRIGRLVAADVNWTVWFQLLKFWTRPDWPRLWCRLTENGGATWPGPMFDRGTDHELRALEFVFGRASNSIAISGSQSASGGALMANDPHLGVHLPGPWLIAGYKSPSFHAVGLMAPGLPFVAVGRNPWIAWGGTNLHALSSDFYDVSDVPAQSITERRERIGVRWWPDHKVTIRETPLGPIVSDAPILGIDRSRPVALRWMGHRPSDEFTAMLKLNQARNWSDFQSAIKGIAVPGQTITYADIHGRVGRDMAVHLPAREARHMRHFILESRSTGPWQRFVTGSELLADKDPHRKFIVSANDAPETASIPVGLFFSPRDRADRLTTLITGRSQITQQDLQDILDDTYAATSHKLAGLFARALMTDKQTAASRHHRDFAELLACWNGRYESDSRGALAFELTLYNFVKAYYGKATISAYWASWTPRNLVFEDLARTTPTVFADAARRSIDRSMRPFRRFGNWGGMHRLRLMHPFGHVPLAGSHYLFNESSARGGTESVYRSVHPFTRRRHSVIFGTSARHISDLSDPDRNFFVLLGGQDGWLGSAANIDQLPLWQGRGTIQVPLQVATARARFAHQTHLSP